MRLTDLDGQLFKRNADGSMSQVQTVAEADGVMFLCPKCARQPATKEDEALEDFKAGIHRVGVHSVFCWFNGRGVPDSETPRPGRWNPAGTSIEDLTFIPPGAVSVLIIGGCGWHGFIRNGNAVEA